MTAAFFALHSKRLPSADMYEKSYMHRDLISHAVLAPGTGFLLTASRDGFIKFWKKVPKGVEFVKQFKAHLGPFGGLACSEDGFLCASIAATPGDHSIKVFDVLNFDMIHMIPDVGFPPLAVAFIHRKQAKPILVVSSKLDGTLRFYYIEDNIADDAAQKDEEDLPGIVGAGADEEKAPGSAAPARDPNAPFFTRSTHLSTPCHLIRYNAALGIVISADVKGNLEYWNAEAPFDFDSIAAQSGASNSSGNGGTRVGFSSKLDTDLYKLLQAKVVPSSLAFSPDGKLFAMMSHPDRLIRIVKTWSGKIWKTLEEETLESINAAQTFAGQVMSSPADANNVEWTPAQQAKAAMYKLDTIDFGRRMAIEREIEKNIAKQTAILLTKGDAAATASLAGTSAASQQHHSNIPIPPSNLVFDESGCYLLYPSLLGVKVFNLYTNTVERILGKVENTERFVNAILFQGVPTESGDSAQQTLGASRVLSSGNALEGTIALEDPTLFVLAYRKERFYWFSQREPEAESASSGRDVLNERPTRQLLTAGVTLGGVSGSSAAAATKLGLSIQASVTLHTSMGDITIQLFPEETPKTCGQLQRREADGASLALCCVCAQCRSVRVSLLFCVVFLRELRGSRSFRLLRRRDFPPRDQGLHDSDWRPQG